MQGMQSIFDQISLVGLPAASGNIIHTACHVMGCTHAA